LAGSNIDAILFAGGITARSQRFQWKTDEARVL